MHRLSTAATVFFLSVTGCAAREITSDERLDRETGNLAVKDTPKAGELEKLSRAPTLVVASAKLTGDEHQNHEDVLATACAVYIVLLAAHGRGLASYWRTPRVLQTREGQAAVGMGEDEEFVALVHLGPRVDEPVAKERAPVAAYVTFLD